MKICDIITETFDSKIASEIVKATNDRFVTKAHIGDRTITFNAERNEVGMDVTPEYVWNLEFTERNTGNVSYGKTGSGNEMQVFSFVVNSTKEFISRYSPTIINFSSETSDKNRTQLYSKMINRIRIPGYKPGPVDNRTGHTVLSIVKDDK